MAAWFHNQATIKDNFADSNNWTGISLLSVPGKVFCTILLSRLNDAVNSILHEEQAPFAKQIFTLGNTVEQWVEF